MPQAENKIYWLIRRALQSILVVLATVAAFSYFHSPDRPSFLIQSAVIFAGCFVISIIGELYTHFWEKKYQNSDPKVIKRMRNRRSIYVFCGFMTLLPITQFVKTGKLDRTSQGILIGVVSIIGFEARRKN
jgi:hypothetical protein